MNFFQNFEETKEKEYYECTDTMAQMKNKINETKKYPHRVFRRRRGPIHRARSQTYTG